MTETGATPRRDGAYMSWRCLAHRRETPSWMCVRRALSVRPPCARDRRLLRRRRRLPRALHARRGRRLAVTSRVAIPADLDGVSGDFTVRRRASAGNHGPVACATPTTLPTPTARPTARRHHLLRLDHQGDELEEQTLATLADSALQQAAHVRLPQALRLQRERAGLTIPSSARHTGGMGLHPLQSAFFRHLERRIGRPRAPWASRPTSSCFHPYDRWGFATMDAERADDRYLRYLVARLAAYRNVWWSMANEYDLMPEQDDGRLGSLLPHRAGVRPLPAPALHPQLPRVLRPRQALGHAPEHPALRTSSRRALWRDQYRKPVVVDECRYEGDIPRALGRSSRRRRWCSRFWERHACAAATVGHGETYLHPQDILWWSKGGVLHGESPARIAFLRRVLEQGPAEGLEPLDGVVSTGSPAPASRASTTWSIVACTSPPQ